MHVDLLLLDDRHAGVQHLLLGDGGRVGVAVSVRIGEQPDLSLNRPVRPVVVQHVIDGDGLRHAAHNKELVAGHGR